VHRVLPVLPVLVAHQQRDRSAVVLPRRTPDRNSARSDSIAMRLPRP
jgi:hypothetical protein